MLGVFVPILLLYFGRVLAFPFLRNNLNKIILGISVWNEHSPKIESALAENKVILFLHKM